VVVAVVAVAVERKVVYIVDLVVVGI